jgi:Holliday junction resolvase
MLMVRAYAKGYAAERSLVHELSGMGYMVLRAPRSGRINLPSPDVIAAKDGKLIVIECKSRAEAFTVPPDQIQQLQEWQVKAGAVPYVAWKVSRKGWFFFHLKDIMENDGHVGKRFAEEKALGINSI